MKKAKTHKIRKKKHATLVKQKIHTGNEKLKDKT